MSFGVNITGSAFKPRRTMFFLHSSKAVESYFYVTDGYKVYPSFIPNGDQIVSKTYMTRVESENTRVASLFSTTASQDTVLFQVLRYAEAFNSVVTLLLKVSSNSYGYV